MRLSRKVVRAIGWDTGGSALASLLTFLTTVWLVRALGAQRYGILAALLAGVALGQLLANGGVRTAILRFVPQVIEQDGTAAAARLLRDAASMRSVFIAAVSAPVVLFPDTVATHVLGRPDLASYLVWTPLLIALPLYADVLNAGLLAIFRQPTVRLAEVGNKIVFAACLAFVPLWPDPIAGVIFAWVAGWACGAVWLVVDARRQGLIGERGSALPHDFQRLARFIGAAYVLSLIAFVLGRELDILLLARFGFADDVVATYAVAFAFVHLAYRVMLLPIAGGFDGPLIAGLHAAGDVDGLRRLFRAYFEYIYLFVTPICAGGIVLGGDLVREIYGAEYRDAAPIVIGLLIALGLAKLSGITGPFMLGTDREGGMLKIRAVFSLVNVVAAWIAIPMWGAHGAALATSITLAGMTTAEGTYVKRFLRPPMPWAFVARTGISAVVMAIVVAGLRGRLGTEPGLVVVLGLAFVGAACYVLLLLLLRPVDPGQAEILERAGAPVLAGVVQRVCRPAAPGPVEAAAGAGHGQELGQ